MVTRMFYIAQTMNIIAIIIAVVGLQKPEKIKL